MGINMTLLKVIFGFVIALSAITQNAAAEDYNTDFNGTWRGSLQRIDTQIHSNALPDLTEHPDLIEFAIEISAGAPSVYIFQEGAWMEVKPDRFGLAVHKTNAILASMDSSFAEDSSYGWVETWNITLTEKEPGTLYAYWVRAVSNPNLPDGSDLSARFFMSRFGTLERSDPIAGANALQASAKVVSSSCMQSEIVCRTPIGNPGESVKFNPKIEQN
jgi:hypothetical protein